MTREVEIEGALPGATGRREKRALLRFWSRRKSEDHSVLCESKRRNQSVVTCRRSVHITNESLLPPFKRSPRLSSMPDIECDVMICSRNRFEKPMQKTIRVLDSCGTVQGFQNGPHSNPIKMTNLEPGLRLIDDLYLTADGLYRSHVILQPASSK